MRMKSSFLACIPAILFLFASLFLSFSPLTLSKSISIQNDALIILFQSLKKNDIGKALISSFLYLWDNVLWIIIAFMIIIGFSFIWEIRFIERINKKALLVSQFIFFLLIILICKSLPMVFTAFSLFIGTLWTQKMFEERKNKFSTGYSIVSSRLYLMTVFLCIGIFLSAFINLQTYENIASESNMKLILSLVPNVTEMKRNQVEEIRQISENFQYSLRERYEGLNESVRTQCEPLYYGLMEGIKGYENRTIEGIENQKFEISGLMKQFPFFQVLIKATPLLLSITAYALLTILIPFISTIGGIVYSLMRIEVKKTKRKRKS